MKATIKKYIGGLIPTSKKNRESNRIAEFEVRVRERDERISSLERAISERERMIQEIRSSWSWRLTGPLRAAAASILWILELFKRLKRLPADRQIGMEEIIGRARACKRHVRKQKRMKEVQPLPFCSASIVIPTKNAGPEFRETLRSIKCQQDVKDIEIVIIDSGSMDGTLEVARGAGAVVATIPPDTFHHARTRNTGVERAKGEYIVFTVQDAVPVGLRWLYSLLEPLRSGAASAVTARQIPRYDAELYACWSMHNHYKYLGLNKDLLFRKDYNAHTNDCDERRRACSLDDVCMAMGRKDFLSYRFDPEISFAEDLELGTRLYDDGHSLLLQASNAVIHSHNRSAAYHLRRSYVDRLTHARLFGARRRSTSSEIVYGETAHFYKSLSRALCMIEDSRIGTSSCFEYVHKLFPTLRQYLADDSGDMTGAKGDSSIDSLLKSWPTETARNNRLITPFCNAALAVARYVDGINMRSPSGDVLRDTFLKCFANVAGAFIFSETSITDERLIEGV